jgi:hypothetical protein
MAPSRNGSDTNPLFKTWFNPSVRHMLLWWCCIHCSLRLLQLSRHSDINAQSSCFLKLSHRANEPSVSPKHPTSKGENRDNSHRNNSIIKCLAGNRIQSRQAENDSDEANPGHRYESNGTGQQAKVERPLSRIEVPGVDEPDENGNSVRDVQSNRGDRSCRPEGYGASEGRQRETEGEEGGKPDGADGGAEPVVDFVEEVWL